LASVHPTGPGVPAAVHALERRDERARGGERLAADRGRRVQHPGELDRGDVLGQLRADRRGQVLDVRDGDEHGLGRGGDEDGVRGQRALDAPRDDRVLLAVLGRLEQLLAEVGVDGGVGAAARRAGQGHRARPQPVAAHEQLGAGGDERRVAAAGAEDEARRERLAQDAEHGSGVVRARRVDLDLAGEHDLVQAPGRMRSTAPATAAS
jgi:hypothetical protein